MQGQKLKLRYLKPRQWCDKDEVLIHALFEVLCRFVEEELSQNQVNWNSDKEHKQARKQMDQLYQWWTKIRPIRDEQDPIKKVENPEWKHVDIVLNGKIDPKWKQLKFEFKNEKHKEQWKKACKESTEFENKCINEDTENMIKLIKIRKFMWT